MNNMQHNFDEVFDTNNELWQRVLDIFDKNEKYEKKVVSNRNLHHKFPRSFSKMLNEPVDNDKDNLISLSLSDHLLVHYYYYLLARKGYRQRMATAFTFMAKKCLKFMTPDTAEAMAKDYEEARTIANQHKSESLKGKHLSDDTRRKMSEAHKTENLSEETRKKLSDSAKGRKLSAETRLKLSELNKGENHPMYGEHHSDESRKKISESLKGRSKSVEHRRKNSESHKGKHWKLVNGKRVYY